MKRPLFLYGVSILALGSVLSACSNAGKGNAAPPATASALSASVPTPYAADSIGRAEDEPILKGMRKIFSETKPDQMNDAIKETKNALLAALHSLPQGGIEIQMNQASFANNQGYMVPVTYRDRAAYELFSKYSFKNLKSNFRTWTHGAGRTPLALSAGGKLVSSWFFLAPQPPFPADLRQEEYTNKNKRSKQ